jgi:SAM-dependent methyltransferase
VLPSVDLPGLPRPGGRHSDRVYGVVNVTGDSALQSDVLEDLSDARRYRRWLADLARPYLGQHPVELGSGSGDFALEWAPSVVTFTATEADEDRYAALAQRFENDPVVRTRYLVLGTEPGSAHGSESPPNKHSSAIAFNVLEHIPRDVAALRAMAALVEPGGAVALVVPAFPSAMSRFDRAIGHQRRYTRRSLGVALANAGLVVEQLRYINPVGLISWYVAVKGLRMRPRNGLLLRLYDRAVVPTARLADRTIVPFGQSVFAIARVP